MDNSSSNKIAVLVKTTPKRKSLLWVINSIELSLDNYRLYIADEEPIDEWKKELYEKLEKEGHYIKIWNERKAVTKARNQLISQLQDEEYVMRLDDDFELGGEFDIQTMLTLLEREDIDFCADIERQIGDGKTKSGQIRIKSGYINFRDREAPILFLKKDRKWDYQLYKGVRYAYADYFRNLVLIKRNCFKKVSWEEKLKFTGEHIDFYMELKKNGFKGVFTPDSIHLHRDDLKHKVLDMDKELLLREKERDDIKEKVFNQKWGGIPEKSKSLIGRLKNKIRNVFYGSY